MKNSTTHINTLATTNYYLTSYYVGLVGLEPTQAYLDAADLQSVELSSAQQPQYYSLYAAYFIPLVVPNFILYFASPKAIVGIDQQSPVSTNTNSIS